MKIAVDINIKKHIIEATAIIKKCVWTGENDAVGSAMINTGVDELVFNVTMYKATYEDSPVPKVTASVYWPHLGTLR